MLYNIFFSIVNLLKRGYSGNISLYALVEPPNNYKIIEIESKGKEKPLVYTQLRHAE